MEAIANKEFEDKFVEFYNKYYIDQINELFISYPQKRSLYVDIQNLEQFDHELANELIGNPDNLIPAANAALSRFSVNADIAKPVYARFYGLDASTMPLIQDVGSEHIGRLLTLDSLVVKRSEIMPMVHVGVFRCAMCNTVVKLEVERDNMPEVCPQCKRRSLRQLNEESKFINLQRLAVQDPLEKLKGSAPTWQLEVWVQDDLVNTIMPGDRVDITGILRIRPRRNQKGKLEKAIFTMFVDVIAIRTKQKEYAELEINKDEEKAIKELSTDPSISDKIARSIAPSIYGFDMIKKAISLQLFGGTPGKTLVDGGVIRNDIHILLIGDPGSAKTRLLQAVTAIVPKGIYISGKSTSSAGLTAAAERDELAEGGWTLKAGALVLGTGGTVAIDEFDKISDDDKSAMLEAMESQTISLAKAGIIARFSTKTSILAAANPKFGRFEQSQYPADQFDIPPTLLSRFDLIFPIKDVIDDEELNKNIARHILIQHEAAGAQLAEITEYEQVQAPPINPDMLRKYVAYARKNIMPRITKEAADRIQNYYVELRRIGMKQGAVPITPRQIEGLIRLAEASAKSRLSNLVELKDANAAIDMYEYMLGTLAVDKSGRKDIDILQTGMPKEKVDKINIIMGIIKKLEKEEQYALVPKVFDEAEKAGIERERTIKFIDELERSGDIYMPKPGVLKTVNREAG